MPTTLIYALSALNCVAALYFLIHGTKMLFDIRLIHRAWRLEVAMSCYFMRTPDFSSQPEWVRLMQEADQIDRRLLKITTFGARQHGELLQSLRHRTQSSNVGGGMMQPHELKKLGSADLEAEIEGLRRERAKPWLTYHDRFIQVIEPLNQAMAVQSWRREHNWPRTSDVPKT